MSEGISRGASNVGHHRSLGSSCLSDSSALKDKISLSIPRFCTCWEAGTGDVHEDQKSLQKG